MKILICEFHQETNTFNPVVNATERFNAGGAFEGEAPYQNLLSKQSVVRGAVDAITAAGGKIVPSVFMHSGSGGRVADEAFALLLGRMKHYIHANPEIDGVYCALHGATCTESVDDACGEFLSFLRGLIGKKPIAVSFDLHAKVTERVLKNADIICGYHTYPHVDFYETGHRAGSRLIAWLEGKKTYRAAVLLPILLPPAGYTTNEGPFKALMEQGLAMVNEGTLLDFSLFPVQPWLDIPEIASCVLAVAEDAKTAKNAADRLAAGLAALAGKADPELFSVAEILELAKKNTTGKPVILADSADSPNGGAVGDSPVAAMALLGSGLRSAVCIRDPKAVEKAFSLGVGAEAEFSVGAVFTPGMPGPMVATGKVIALFPKGGMHPELKDAAVVQFGEVTVLLATNGHSTGYPQFYRDMGILPEECDLVVVKANTSFRAYYTNIAGAIYVSDTPGAGASNLRQFTWKKLPKGMYPFDLPADYTPEKAKLM